MKGYFGIGVEGLSKPMNAGNLFRSAHAFGASFIFTVAAEWSPDIRKSDTSDAAQQVPLYRFDSVETMRLPNGCALVGVELMDDAVDLPSFRHPRCAAYVLGMERGSLSAALVDCCDHLIKIPTRFSLNLAAAGAIVMYDRILSIGRFGARPVVPGGPVEAIPPHEFGRPVVRRRRHRNRTEAAVHTAGRKADRDGTG